MWPALTAVFRAADRKPCLLAMVLGPLGRARRPVPPPAASESTQVAISDSRSLARGMDPIGRAVMSERRYSSYLSRVYCSIPVSASMWVRTQSATVSSVLWFSRRGVGLSPCISMARSGPWASMAARKASAERVSLKASARWRFFESEQDGVRDGAVLAVDLADGRHDGSLKDVLLIYGVACLHQCCDLHIMVELRGIEPLTFSMRTRRATNCAIAPCAGSTLPGTPATAETGR